MSLTCPACRASNDAGPACRRCKADLSLLFAIDAQRTSAIAAAQQALADGRAGDAEHAARAADSLRRGPDAKRLLAAAALLRRDFAAAWIHHAAAGSMAGG